MSAGRGDAADGDATDGDAGEATALRIDGFADLRRIGSGGFSTVYGAVETRMGRPVAIKVLHSDLSSPTDRRVFERECQVMGLLSRHPNIVTVYRDASTDDGRACLVMELYHGNYRKRLDDGGPLPIDEVLAVGVKIAGALQTAHDMGVLHRDIKPHNIFLSDFDEPALGDFGISTIDNERSITGVSALSVAYSAPEVLEDGAPDFLSDVFSLAATLHHLLDGRSPFASPQIAGVMRRILDDDPNQIRRAGVPDALRIALRSGLASDPRRRPESAGDLAGALQDVQSALGHDRTPSTLRQGERHPAPARVDDRGHEVHRRGGEARRPSIPARPAPASGPTDPQPGRGADAEETAPTVRRPRTPLADETPVPEAVGRHGSDVPIGWTSHRREPSVLRRHWVDVLLVVVVGALLAYAAVGLF